MAPVLTEAAGREPPATAGANECRVPHSVRTNIGLPASLRPAVPQSSSLSDSGGGGLRQSKKSGLKSADHLGPRLRVILGRALEFCPNGGREEESAAIHLRQLLS